jgi:hypothetical protein
MESAVLAVVLDSSVVITAERKGSENRGAKRVSIPDVRERRSLWFQKNVPAKEILLILC